MQEDGDDWRENNRLVSYALFPYLASSSKESVSNFFMKTTVLKHTLKENDDINTIHGQSSLEVFRDQITESNFVIHPGKLN